MNVLPSLSATRILLSAARRWVVKVGSALLTNDGRGLDVAMVGLLANQVACLRASGCEVVLVSSGAVAAGVARLGWQCRPTALHDLQAAAAVGQSILLQQYEQAFQTHGLATAQILLGHDDVAARDRYLNARGTLTTLLRLDVLPIVNENDTVATEEIRFGDNDSLAALVANLIDAEALLLLTDQDGLFDADPRLRPEASLLAEVDVHDPRLDGMVGDGGAFGRGGMVTKLRAARLAAPLARRRLSPMDVLMALCRRWFKGVRWARGCARHVSPRVHGGSGWRVCYSCAVSCSSMPARRGSSACRGAVCCLLVCSMFQAIFSAAMWWPVVMRAVGRWRAA